MFSFTNKADMALRIHDSILGMCRDQVHGVDGTRALLLLAGVIVETALLFDNNEEAIDGHFFKLEKLLGCPPAAGPVPSHSLPPPTFVDFDTEQGRALARDFFEEWLDCAYEFHEMLLSVIQDFVLSWERQGQHRSESFRLLIEGVRRCMIFELAAQELCDVVIEDKIGIHGWSMGDCISGLSGSAGHLLADSHGGQGRCCWFQGNDLPDALDQTSYVMTQEAVRHGIPAGTDWRLGLAANDCPPNAPVELVRALEQCCQGFFDAVDLHDASDKAVALAKAAGRMVAVAAGGARPSIEPAIAKPLAMAALTESYKNVCVEYAVVS